MERATRDYLATKAEVSRTFPRSNELSQRQRLERWSELLAQQPHRLLNTFPMTEFMAAQMRDAMRCADSPITVAFEDPVLREAGLTDDSYGTAKLFFGLSDRHMHWIVCYCHHGMSVRAGVIATVVRSAMPRMPRLGLFGWLKQAFAAPSI